MTFMDGSKLIDYSFAIICNRQIINEGQVKGLSPGNAKAMLKLMNTDLTVAYGVENLEWRVKRIENTNQLWLDF
jgi:hypothetical protein